MQGTAKQYLVTAIDKFGEQKAWLFQHDDSNICHMLAEQTYLEVVDTARNYGIYVYVGILTTNDDMPWVYEQVCFWVTGQVSVKRNMRYKCVKVEAEQYKPKN